MEGLHKTFPVGGKYAEKYGSTGICSAEDFDMISAHKWRWTPEGYLKGYVNGKDVMISRFIMRVDSTHQNYVDHVDSNTANNSRENLRLVTPAENSQNRKKRKKTTSKYFGVSYNKAGKKFRSSIKFNGNNTHIGTFESEFEAAVAYDSFVVNHSENLLQKLNFPDKIDEYKTSPTILQAKKKRKFFGVYEKQKPTRFVSQTQMNGSSKHIGSFKTETEAAKAYDKFVVANELKGTLNFPSDYADREIASSVKTFYTETDDPNVIRLTVPLKPDDQSKRL